MLGGRYERTEVRRMLSVLNVARRSIRAYQTDRHHLLHEWMRYRSASFLGAEFHHHHWKSSGTRAYFHRQRRDLRCGRLGFGLVGASERIEYWFGDAHLERIRLRESGQHAAYEPKWSSGQRQRTSGGCLLRRG